MLVGWDPPQADGTYEVPVTENERPQRWWRRSYRRVPIWAWAVGGVLALGAVSNALEPAEVPIDSAQADIAAAPPEATVTPTTIESAPSTTAEATPSTQASATLPATPAATTTVNTTSPPTTTPATTSAPNTTQAMIVVTLPPTTTTRPPPPPPTTTLPPPPPPRPPTTVAVQPFLPTGACDPNYTGCVPIDSDVDCAGGSGNGPSYANGPVSVIGTDIYELDRDGDGIACDR